MFIPYSMSHTHTHTHTHWWTEVRRVNANAQLNLCGKLRARRRKAWTSFSNSYPSQNNSSKTYVNGVHKGNLLTPWCLQNESVSIGLRFRSSVCWFVQRIQLSTLIHLYCFLVIRLLNLSRLFNVTTKQLCRRSFIISTSRAYINTAVELSQLKIRNQHFLLYNRTVTVLPAIIASQRALFCRYAILVGR
jgi:hypothetical protein